MKQEFKYLSSDGTTMIGATEWVPDETPAAAVQISHGMVEFIDRYDEFARFLNSRSIYVVGNDHLGHGRSVKSPNDLGYFAEKNGNECVIRDMLRLRALTQNKLPLGLPYFMLGHSMGSFLVRQFITEYGDGLAGAIIVGTGWQSGASLRTGKALCRIIGSAKGDRYRSGMLLKLALGSNNNAFEPARTPCDWLTKDEAIVDAYVANPLNTFRFTVNGYYNMFRGIETCEDPKAVAAIPKDLPLLILSGAEDPVGAMGKGVRKTYDCYRKAGIRDVKMKLYPNDRHEILNETDRDAVYEDLAGWLSAHIDGGSPEPDEPAVTEAPEAETSPDMEF